MAILVEQISEMCERRYSDAGVMLRQIETGELFPDAVDTIPCRFSYEETDEPVPDEDAEESDYIGALGALGVSV